MTCFKILYSRDETEEDHKNADNRADFLNKLSERNFFNTKL
jgi:hypothetical protein